MLSLSQRIKLSGLLQVIKGKVGVPHCHRQGRVLNRPGFELTPRSWTKPRGSYEKVHDAIQACGCPEFHSGRLVGTMQAGKTAYAVIQSTDGRMRLEHPSNFQNINAVMIGEVDGECITVWSGSKPTPKGR